MAIIRCQACGKPNPDFLEQCQYCEARLKPATGAAADETLIRPPSNTIRCQACGRSNASDRELCQYCEARLRPLVAETPGEQTTPPPQAASDDPLARLRSTQTFEPDTSDSEPAETPDEAGPTAWMSRLRGVSAASPSDETMVPGNRLSAEPEPDWMFTEAAQAPAEEGLAWLRDEPPPPADVPPAANDDELPDWLANLRSATGMTRPPEPPELPTVRAVPTAPPEAPPAPTPSAMLPAPTASDDDELPEWLRLDEPASAPAPKPVTGPQSRKKMTDWLTASPDEALPAEAAPETPAAPAAEAPTGPGVDDTAAASGDDEPADVSPTDQTLPPPARPRRKKMTDWLTPAEGGLPPQVPAPKPSEPEAELPDWLKAMQPVEEVPDWLRDVASAPRVFNRPTVPTDTPAQTPPAGETTPLASADIGLPDWLKDAGPKTEAPPPEATPPQAPETPPTDLPDWLLALRASPEAPPAEAEATSADPLAPARRQQELPTWLQGATGVLPPEPEAPTPTEPATTDSTPEGAPASSAAIPAAEATLPWLAAASAVEAEPEPESEAPAAQPGDYELPDWLRPSPEAMATAEAELAVEPPVDVAAVNAAELARAEEELPDWLRSLPTASAVDEVADETLIARAPEADIPAWLRPAGPPPSPPEPPDDAEALDTLVPGEMPDWLQTIQAQAGSPTLPTAEQAADLPPLDDETLAWLTASSTAISEAAPAAGEAATGAPRPDWLEEFKTVSEAAPPPSAMDAVPDVAEEAAAEPTPVEEMPDWLKALRGMPTTEQPSAEAMPDWLRTLRGIPPPSTTEISQTPAAPEPAPTSRRATEEAASAKPAPVEAEGEAETALPAWLAAMRPTDIEHPADAEVDAYEENVGVLAGMRGVLRAEPTAAQPHRSTTHVQQLVVADVHAKQAKVLAGLLAEEEAARPPAIKPARLAQYLERWLVFVVLALAILVPQFALPDMFGVPTSISAEARAAFEAVSVAPVSQPALVAFDYDPAQQGELNPAAVAMVTHLMSRGVPVVAVSTRPLGAAVGHAVLEQVAADLGARANVSYTHGAQYLNLGYIPGGPVGLLQFAAAPRSVFAADFTGAGPASVLWTQPVLRGVEGLSDFGLVIFVTASPDDTRAWIEQSQAYAGGIPRLAVVSAGAEPMVRPYIEGEVPQLDGLVAGLVGAAQYEQQAGLPGVATRHWSALGGGLWAAVLLIAGGNAVYATVAAIRRRRR